MVVEKEVRRDWKPLRSSELRVLWNFISAALRVVRNSQMVLDSYRQDYSVPFWWIVHTGYPGKSSVAPLTSTEENVLREGKAAIKAVANCLVDRLWRTETIRNRTCGCSGRQIEKQKKVV